MFDEQIIKVDGHMNDLFNSSEATFHEMIRQTDFIISQLRDMDLDTTSRLVKIKDACNKVIEGYEEARKLIKR